MYYTIGSHNICRPNFCIRFGRILNVDIAVYSHSNFFTLQSGKFLTIGEGARSSGCSNYYVILQYSSEDLPFLRGIKIA